MALLAHQYGLIAPLQEFATRKPVWGTCAGMILLSKTAQNAMKGGQELLEVLDITVKRNAFGHQVDSFVGDLDIPKVGEKFPGVFIRAPVIEQCGPGVEVLCRIPEKDNVVVACRQGHILACSFHPELTNDVRFHQYFLSMIK